MLTLKINTKNKKTLTIIADRLNNPKETLPENGDDFHFEIFQGDQSGERLIMSFDCQYMRAEGYKDNDVGILDSQSAPLGEVAVQLFHPKGTRKAYKHGNILMVELMPGEYTIDKGVIFDEAFDVDTMIRGIQLAAESFAVKQDIPEYFVFFGNANMDPTDALWDEKLKNGSGVRFNCKKSYIVEENCYFYLYTKE